MRRLRIVVLPFAIVFAGAHATAQSPQTIPEMWTAWCARCHAPDGSGRMADRPVPVAPLDFTDCRVATPEPDADWELAIREGGPAVGLSSMMPGFGDALTPEQIRGFVAYIRTFCREAGWPHGNLNFPRPMFTEKAFPENELLIVPMAAHSSTAADAGSARVVYERRLGRRTQFELGVPLAISRVGAESFTGLGDLELAAKHVLASSTPRNAILSGGMEIVLPTGRESRGLGSGSVVFEPFLAAGIARGGTYLQSQMKLELPARGGREFIYNAYAGRDLGGRPDTWTLGLELNGENGELALTPQARKGLTRTGALAGAIGARVPLNRRHERGVSWIGYLLWEYLEPVRAAR